MIIPTSDEIANSIFYQGKMYFQMTSYLTLPVLEEVSGRRFNNRRFEEIIRIARDSSFAWAETISHMDADRPLESIAKTYSLVVLNNNLNHRLRLMERHIKEYRVDGLVIHSAKSCEPYSVGQYNLKRLLMDHLRVPQEGTYYLLIDITSLGFDDEVAFCRMLPEKAGVAAIPCSCFWNNRHRGRELVRFYFCKRDETLDEAIKRLTQDVAYIKLLTNLVDNTRKAL